MKVEKRKDTGCVHVKATKKELNEFLNKLGEAPAKKKKEKKVIEKKKEEPKKEKAKVTKEQKLANKVKKNLKPKTKKVAKAHSFLSFLDLLGFKGRK